MSFLEFLSIVTFKVTLCFAFKSHFKVNFRLTNKDKWIIINLDDDLMKYQDFPGDGGLY
jgi:hypothetical protein